MVEDGKRDQKGRHRIGDLQLRLKRTIGRHSQIREEKAFQRRLWREDLGTGNRHKSHALRLPEKSGNIWKTS